MNKSHHKLAMYRKHHPVTQSDVAFLMNYKDNSLVSKYEKWHRPPTVDFILAYHVLFDTQLGMYFAERRNHIKNRLASRIRPRIAEIKSEPPTSKSKARIAFLEELLTRLNHRSL